MYVSWVLILDYSDLVDRYKGVHGQHCRGVTNVRRAYSGIQLKVHSSLFSLIDIHGYKYIEEYLKVVNCDEEC